MTGYNLTLASLKAAIFIVTRKCLYDIVHKLVTTLDKCMVADNLESQATSMSSILKLCWDNMPL